MPNLSQLPMGAPARRPVWVVTTRKTDEEKEAEQEKRGQHRKWMERDRNPGLYAERLRLDAEAAEEEEAAREAVEESARALEEERQADREERARERAERKPPPPPPKNAVERAKWALEDTLDAARRKLLQKPPMSQRERRARDERRHPEWRVQVCTQNPSTCGGFKSRRKAAGLEAQPEALPSTFHAALGACLLGANLHRASLHPEGKHLWRLQK